MTRECFASTRPLGMLAVAVALGSAQIATSRPASAQSLVGLSVYPGFGSPFSPYGVPYGSPYYNPSLNLLTNPQQQQQNGAVPYQQQQPGQTQTQATQQGLQSFQNGGGNSGGAGNGGGGGGGGNAGGGGGDVSSDSGGGAADGASYELLQNPNSPLYRRYEQNSNVTTPLRPQILTQIGRGNGIRQGFIEESRRISTSLETDAARLDARYDFSRQMIGAHLLPPVIGELHNVKERNGDQVLYLTLGAYQIVRPARLILNPPNWRDYLSVSVAQPDTALPALKPEDGDEQSIYDQSYQAGVAKGILEARDTFEDNLNRLERDYTGMERYHELARQGAVSLPVVNDSRRAVRVADGGQRAFVGEQVVTLQISPKFKGTRPGAYR